MPTFSSISRARLMECNYRIQKLFSEVVKEYDCTILEGHRSEARQRKLLEAGATTTMNSKHLEYPSEAIDVSPYPIPDEWGENNQLEKAKFYHFAGYVQAKADELGVKIRWGGDWDGDKDFDDQTFFDLVHFELEEE